MSPGPSGFWRCGSVFPQGFLGLQFVEQAVDTVAVFGRSVEPEVYLGNRTQVKALAYLAPDEAFTPFEGGHSIFLLLGRAQHAYVDAGVLEVLRYFHASDGGEADARVLQLTLDQVGHMLLYRVGNLYLAS